MAAEFTLGTMANCSDGLCGVICRTILDPAAGTVTHLVIEPRHRGELGRLVPVELVDAVGGEIRLRCTIAEFERLDPAEEIELVEDADYVGGYGPDEAMQGYGGDGILGVGGSASGMGIGMGHRPQAFVSHAVPLGETEVARHEHVHAVDGEIGQVEGFVVNAADHTVTHILLKEGHLWGRKQVAIPMSTVSSVADGIHLNITKKQVEDLPPVETVERK